ncbi:MAG: FAD-dependent thymidylate synthase [Oscillospiraceae bacterium]|jgi:thymidylate synthase (FAD)|nr:FAD-dependent thymidylate synthase [Oscillospiraceae bacterium]
MAKVALISYTKESELIVACAAKLCYSSEEIAKLKEGLTPSKISSFIDMLAKLGHESPIEHASFTFGIEGVSRALLAQITRHRIASFSVQSQRYVSEEGGFSYVIPPEISKDKEANQVFSRVMEECEKSYENLVSILRKNHQSKLISRGMDTNEAQKLAQKMSIEDARFVLPNACKTKMICTFNARSLMNFFGRRLCNRAQWEIRELALLMLKSVLEVAPNLFSRAGPACLYSFCKEGKMSCRREKEVKSFFMDILKNSKIRV